MKNNTVLLIHAPIASPAIPSWESSVAAGVLSGSGFDCRQYDANLDFFLNYILSRNKRQHYLERIENHQRSGTIPNTDFKLIEKTGQRIAKNRISISSLRKPSFFDPERFMAIKRHLEDLFLFFSYAYFPCQIGWGPRFIASEALIEDQNMNPFMLFCKGQLYKKIRKEGPEMVVLFMATPEQNLAGKTMAGFIKSTFPEKKVVGVGAPHCFEMDDAFFDCRFSMDDQQPFFDWISSVCQIRIKAESTEPEFNDLPLKDYLVPETVLPVQVSSFKDKASFQNFLSTQQKTLGAGGFIIRDDMPGKEDLPGIDLSDLGFPGIDFSDLYFSVAKDMNDTDHVDTSRNLPVNGPPGLKMISWHPPRNQKGLEVKALWKTSKQGIWNHVNISENTPQTLRNDLFSFIASNPNIGHSFENNDRNGRFHLPDKIRIDSCFNSYAGVEQLKGRAFWKILADPVYLLLYLKRYGKSDLFCLRADENKRSLIRLGNDIRFFFKKPGDLPVGYLDEICRMVEAGGSVNIKYVRYNLERAFLIGYATEHGVIVGNSSLKHPREEFINRINRITQMDFTCFLERGYTSVRPEYRALGVGAKLLEGLTARAGDHKVFSIISEDNKATQKIAMRNKTRKIATYYSEKVGKELGVWMPEKMMDDPQ